MELSLEEVNKRLKQYGVAFFEELPISELETFKNHRRLQTFYHKGTTCSHPGCKEIGTRLIRTFKKTKMGTQYHVDLFTDDYIMINVDHIKSKAKGGVNHISNYQPMCYPHNIEKGSK